MKSLLIEIDKGLCGAYDWLLFGSIRLPARDIMVSYYIDAFFHKYFPFYVNRWNAYFDERIK